MTRTLAPLLFVSLFGVGLCWFGCGGDDHPSVVPTGTVPTSTGPSDCSAPGEGCACSVPGSMADCRKIRKSGDYISCSIGVTTCGADKRWGPCIGDGIWVPPEAGVDARSDAPDAD